MFEGARKASPSARSLYSSAKCILRKRPITLATSLIFFMFLLLKVLPMSTSICTDPSLTIVVLTANRPSSLLRLLHSLSRATYGCARVDLTVHVDYAVDSREETLRTSLEHPWAPGKKSVLPRVETAGLSKSWFESAYFSGMEYVMILEDDMQVSTQFYRVFRELHKRGALSGTTTSGFCLHPGDWEVNVPFSCTGNSASKYLYLSPEPCNWAPIWRATEWQAYVEWVTALKNHGSLPYVPERYSYNYNKYLREGQDVQSSWVWRYNFDTGKRFLRYSMSTCGKDTFKDTFLAINHKEVGTHFLKKVDIDTDTRKLNSNANRIIQKLDRERHAFVPSEFPGYVEDAQSLHG
jgi:hypothetical protein